MTDDLVIGGTRFIGRALVEQLRAADRTVTLFTRGEHANPFETDEGVTHVQGDRTDDSAVAGLADREPQRVFDTCAFHPPEVRHATSVFSDATYVLVSSGSAYDDDRMPFREDETPLHDDPDDEFDDSVETYGPRKAACDRAVFAGAADGVRAMTVRPMLVYGPRDYTERFNYWVSRVVADEPFLVPGDGASVFHRAYVGDVARALRVVAREGTAGEAYNAADRRVLSNRTTFDRLGSVAGVEPEPVYASQRELTAAGIDTQAFPLYAPDSSWAATDKLAALGWSSTPLDEALAATVEDVRNSERTGSEFGPDPETAESLIAELTSE